MDRGELSLSLMHRNKGTPRQVYQYTICIGLILCLPVAIKSDRGRQCVVLKSIETMISAYPLSGPILTRSAQLDMRGTTARSASAICFSQSFAVDHTKRTEAHFIAHSSTAQKATFIRVNNRSLKLHVFIK